MPNGWRAELDRHHPLVGTLWSLRERRPVTVPELDRALFRADFILLGEQHDNPDHHLLQSLVIERLVALGRPPAVVLEMLPREGTPDLSSYRGGADGLGAFLAWEERGWPDWRLYEPLGRSLLRHGLPIYGAEVSKEERRAVGEEGFAALPQGARQDLLLDRPLPAAGREKLLAALEEGHCGLLPRDALGPMAAVQRLRDARLAEGLLTARAAVEPAPAVLIAGAGHVRADYGVPWYLRRRAPAAESLVLAFVEVAAGEEAPESYPLASAADYLWFTPAAERGDPCAALKQRLGGG